MKTRNLIRAGALAAALMFAREAPAQRLYNKQRDDTAQKAADAGKALASGETFQKELKNLETLSKLEIDSLFQGAARELRNKVDGLAENAWGDVRKICTVSAASDDKAKIAEHQAKAKLLDIQVKQAEAKATKRQQSAASRAADAAVHILSNGGDANNMLGDLLKYFKDSKSAGEVSKVSAAAGKIVTEAGTAAGTVATELQKVEDLQNQLQALEASLDDLAAQRLRIEADHERELAAVIERSTHDQQSVIDLAKDCLALLKNFSAEDGHKVVDDLILYSGQKKGVDSQPEKLDLALQSLFAAAAIGARTALPSDDLTLLRNSQADLRYSIRKSQLEAHSYEVAIGGGAQRLSLYYKGGVRPETIAQIVHAISSAALPTVLGVKDIGGGK